MENFTLYVQQNEITAQRRAAYNTGLSKVTVQCSVSAQPRWLIKHCFSALTFVVKIVTFAKPENVIGYSMTDSTQQ